MSSNPKPDTHFWYWSLRMCESK